MAAEATADGAGERGDQEDVEARGETKTLANSQAEAVIMRELELRERTVDVLRDLEADARCDPARLPERRLDELDDVIGDLMLFSKDLRDLEPPDGDAPE
jgi:hypothetical protein